jgi:2-polyprenyl-6-hydroxyphenyl methylase/3-demethylubiquinone-9 3-methyltransferase
MGDYYRDRLSAAKLKRVYEITTPRVRQYLQAEIDHVLQKIRPGDTVLELGCGYGRVMPDIAGKAGRVVGIDTSLSNLVEGLDLLAGVPRIHLLQMDALHLAFSAGVFDAVVCIQNGISAFHVDPLGLIKEALRVARSGATVLFSSYSKQFWEHRLEWFELQADAGLLGKIDRKRTREGFIETEDGFTATTISREQFLSYAAALETEVTVEEVDGSSVFCELVPL